jgi:hypothetical protein
MTEAVIVAAVRTPVGRAPNGVLRGTRPDELAAIAIGEALRRAPAIAPAEVDDVIIGCAMPEAEQGLNVARIASLRAGIPVSASALVCFFRPQSWLSFTMDTSRAGTRKILSCTADRVSLPVTPCWRLSMQAFTAPAFTLVRGVNGPGATSRLQRAKRRRAPHYFPRDVEGSVCK